MFTHARRRPYPWIWTVIEMAAPYQPGEGFHFDELSKIRVIDPQAATQTEELKDECKEFVDS